MALPKAKQATESKTSSSRSGVPPLQGGDRLSRTEFERRYKLYPYIKKAELIEGVVYMPSPVHHQQHSQPHARIIGWLFTYLSATPGVDLGDNATVRLDLDNEVQPDAFLRIDTAHGGQSQVSEDDYIEGAPELIVEIAASSAAYDLHDKLRVYRRNAVQEYLVLLAHERETIWYVLEAETYQPLPADDNGILRSRVFPGLFFHSEKFWADDLTGLLDILKQGLATPEHDAFVTSLQ